MELSLTLKYINEHGQILPCVLDDEEVVISSFRYEAVRMAGAPTISFTIKNQQLLDDFWKGEWNNSVFVEFRSEKYFLAHIPTSTLSNENGLYTHEVEMVSERIALDNVYFYDVVSEDTEDDRPASNGTNVTFHGTIHEFVERFNSSLQYAKLQKKNDDGTYDGYRVYIDSNVESESKLVAFDKSTMSSVLQTIFTTYNLPYYFAGKEIHIGYASDVISEEFEYGADDALLSIKKENSNNNVINRCTGVGSSENIPYFYPNSTPIGNVGVEFTGSGITSATIEDGNKFSGNSLLENTLTYNHIESNQVGNVTYGCWKNGSRAEEYIVPFVTLDEVNAFGSRQYSVFCIVDTRNQEFAGTRHIKVRMSVKIAEIVQGSDASATEKFKNNLLIDFPFVRVSMDGGDYKSASDFWTVYDNAESISKKENIIEIHYHIAQGHTYKFDVAPRIWTDLEDKGGLASVLCKLNASFETTYANNNSYVVGYGWTYNDIDGEQKVQSLSDIGVVVKGTPNVGDTLKFTLISRFPNQSTLMPSIFRTTFGKERFFNAENGKYDGYDFPNPYVEGQPKEYIKDFEDIKPTITGMVNAGGIAIDRFLDFEYDDDDDNEVEEIDDNLVVKHPYFFAKLPKLGFNLFQHASEKGEMTISMTSGNCGACNFVIAVDTQQEGKYFNTVQVGNNGRPLKDENGNVICGRKHYQSPIESIQPEQNDTTDNEVWIALKKEDQTYGVQMPFREKTIDENGNVFETSILPSVEDTFVILNINLPEEYILAAEKRLDKAILDYMLENNHERFNYSIDFSRIYLQENPSILEQLTENARIKIRYDNRIYVQYVNSFSYSVDSSAALPEIKVELVENLELYESPIERAMSEVGNAFGQMLAAFDAPMQCLPYFMRKDVEDSAYRKVTFNEGAEFGRYQAGALGSGGAISIDGNGNSIAEFDYLNVRKKASFTELTIQELKNVGGQLIVSPAAMKCSRVVKLANGDYRCYFETTNDAGDKVQQEFIVGDLACCQTFNVTHNRYYWREVVGIGEDYVDLSSTLCDTTMTNDEPLAGDTIVSIGNTTDVTRQSAIILSAYGNNAPSMTQYAGIDSYSLEDKMVTKFSNGENVVTGKMTILPNSTGASNFTDLEVGGANLIRNSGFTGNYVSKELDDQIVLEAASELYSDPFEYWGESNAVVQDSSESQSGKEVVVADGNISQDLETPIIANENYVLSFKAKGTNVTYSVGGVENTIELTNEYVRYVEKFTAISDFETLLLSGTYTLCEVQLERGTIASAWSNNFKDNTSDRTYYQAQKYLSDAIHNKSIVEGALTLTQIVGVGDYANGEMTKMTGGMSGRYAGNDNNVAFWAGGDFEAAINTVAKYQADSSYQPTEEELASMAKFVVTHGGRAILNDIILRGYIYALGGVFKGTIYADSGVFSGLVKRTPTIINADNYTQYMAVYESNDEDSWYDLDLEKAGSFIIFEGDLPVAPHFYLPLLHYSTTQGYVVLPTSKTMYDVMGMVGQQVIIINNSNTVIHICSSNGCHGIPNGDTATYQCIMVTVTDEVVGTRWKIDWERVQHETPVV